ncbi:hypothetical protein ACROYT_G000613 [Oculina patagonica]
MALLNATGGNYSDEETLLLASDVMMTSTASKVFKIIPLAIVMLASIAGNSIVVHAVYADVRMQTATNILIVSQSIVDLGTSVLVIPFALISVGYDGWIFGDKFCAANGFFNLYFTQITVLQLVIIAFDRYQVIVKPSRRAIDIKDAVKLTAIAWCVSFLGSFPWLPLLTNRVDVVFFPGFYVCAHQYLHDTMDGLEWFSVVVTIAIFAVSPLFLIFYCYYQINKVINLNRHRVSPVSLSNAQKLAINVYAKSASTSKVVIGTSLLQVFPACFILLLDGLRVGPIPHDLETATKWIMWCHCIVKPIIYAAKSRVWARAIRSYLVTLPIVSSIIGMDLKMRWFSTFANRVKAYRLSRRRNTARPRNVNGRSRDEAKTAQQNTVQRPVLFSNIKLAWQAEEQKRDFCAF